MYNFYEIKDDKSDRMGIKNNQPKYEDNTASIIKYPKTKSELEHNNLR
jgi:hypothetical protein